MQKHFSRLLLTLAILFSASVFAPAWAESSSTEPIPGVVRVKLQKSAALRIGASPRHAAKGKALTTGIEALDTKLKSIKGISLEKVFPCPPGREAAHAAFGLDQWYEIRFDESVTPLEARRILSEAIGVETATVRRPIELFDDGTPRVVDTTAASSRAAAQMPFNDPKLSAQWHYFNDGSLNGALAGADINLFEAWKVTTGSPDVIVAVIDGGIDPSHEDLVANLWVNPGEIPGNGIDDDKNGYVDDVNGYNFCTQEGKIAAHQHGTHVAGTIAAVNNNGIGVAGVAGGDGTPGSGVRLMSVQVFDSRSGTGDPDVAKAIVYAADMGATIANCSWGWSDGYRDESVIDAIRYFTLHAQSGNMKGGLCIFAAGNEGENAEVYPACMPEVLAVGAMSPDGRACSYSNHGPWVDVTAPGGLLTYSTYEGVLSTLPGNKYGYLEGTSMAAPHVTGIAALILSKHGSPTFTNEGMRTQLTTSVNDFYLRNPELEGLFGSGYIDAAKSLLWSDGSAPGVPVDFTVFPAQDNITVSWIIPHTSDNTVAHHILYYSTQPFTAETLSTAKSVVIDTKYNVPGEKCDYNLTGLEPITTYYLAMQAVDRWGTVSELTEVLQTSTNRGPAMSVDLGGNSSLSIISDAAHRIAETSFTIKNSDEGLLKWSSYLRNRTHSISAYSMTPSLISVPYKGTVGIVPCSANSVMQAEEFIIDEYPKQIKTWDMMNAYIGDTDLERPNSMAQMFNVDPKVHPNGFNLTAVSVSGIHGTDPIIEIYRGSNIMSPSNRVLRWTPSYFSYGSNLRLPEQIFFEPGENFFVVVHFPVPQEQRYPLGLALAPADSPNLSIATQAYMSNDMGETWTILVKALEGSIYENQADRCTWAITAVSQNPDFSTAISLNPAEGQVAGNSDLEVKVIADATKLINGTYNATIRFRTNESEENDIAVPVQVTVEGQKPDVVFNKIVDFGNLIIGHSKTITVEVFNKGYGNFSNRYGQLTSGNISSTSDQFEAPSYLTNGFPARSTTSFDITFTPTIAGSHSGQIVFTSEGGQTLRIMLQGTATEAPKITVSPASGVDSGDLVVGGDSKNVSFTIANDGKYPLQYLMPKYTDEQLDGITADSSHKFGYTWTSNLNGAQDAVYQPMPELTDAVDVASQFSDYNYWTKSVKLGFDFPYFGRTYDEVYITSFGGVAMNPYLDGLIYSPISEKDVYVMGTGLISAFGSNQLQMGPDSKVEYAKADGKFVVCYKNVLASVYDQDYTPISFHMTLSPTGDVEIFYDSFNPQALFHECRGLFVALLDINVEDPLIVTSSNIANNPYTDPGTWTERGSLYKSFGSGTAIKFVAPKPNLIRSVSPVIGMIAPGESVEINVTVSASDDMFAGPTFTDLTVLSNDPKSPSTSVRFNANIVGDLHPELNVPEEMSFGEVFRTAKVSRPLSVKNNGKANLTINSVSFAQGRFTANFSSPVEVPAAQSKDILVTMPTAVEGTVTDVMTIVTSAGTAVVNVTGTVIGCPDITLGYESVDETLAYNDIKAIPLNISNTGNAPMSYSITTGNYVDYTPTFTDNSKVSYKYSASVDDPAAKRDWVDIETTGLGNYLGLTYFIDHSYVEVQLPFEFPFFDRKYSTMYVYNSGFVSFTKRSDDGSWPDPPEDFEGSVYDNLIAPYWGMHSMSQTMTAGIYTYATDEYAVVSFTEYNNSMNSGVDYQVIMRKDGSFTFNYKAHSEYSVIFSMFGLAGISNIAGADGIMLPERAVKFGESVNFAPKVLNTLNPGESTAIDLKLNASSLAGVYTSEINLATDIPSKENISIPVNLTITGRATGVFPEDIVSEHVAGYMSTDFSDWWVQNGAAYYETFEIANSGSAAFTIRSIDFRSAMAYDPDWDEEYPAFMLFYYGETEDFFTGAMTKQWMMYDGSPITVGKEPVKFAVPMMPDAPLYTPATYENRIILSLSGIPGVPRKEIKVTYVVTEAPEITLDKEEIRVSGANDNTVVTEKVTITNTGRYRLTYDYYLDPSGQGEAIETDDFGGGIAPWNNAAASIIPLDRDNLIKPMDTGLSDNYLNTPNNSADYTDALYWEAFATQSSVYAIGSGNTYEPFRAATAYTGPEGSFTISHLYILIAPYNLGGKTITASISNGNLKDGDDILGKGTYTIPANINESYGPNMLALIIVPFNRPVYITEGQQFYAVVDFPAGSATPIALISKVQEVVDDRYLAYAESYGQYVDIAGAYQSQAGSLGYVMTCLQTVKSHPWAELASTERSGVLEPGESAEIEVVLTGITAPKDRDNKSVLVIKSNDIERPIVNFPIYLDRNAAPYIECETDKLLVNEGETAELVMKVYDMDGDKFAFRLDDANPARAAKIASVTKVNPDEADAVINEFNPQEHFYEVSNSVDGVYVKVAISPDFGQAGEYSFTLTALDVNSQFSEMTVDYSVAHVNRAPQAEASSKIEMNVGATTEPISLYSLFTDPDGDDLSFTVTPVTLLGNSGVADIYQSGSSVIFHANKAGFILFDVTATDPDGASATHRINITVKETDGIDDITLNASTSVYPNPVVDILYVTTGFDAADARYAVYNMAGALVINETADAVAGIAREINVGNLASGIYVLRLDAAGQSASWVIVKE